MDKAAIKNELTLVFRDVFNDDSIELTPTTTAKDIQDWDSLNHINLVVAVEKRFKVKFTVKEVSTLPNVGAFMELIERRVSLP